MDYQNTVIYKIKCRDESISDCYVGQTTNFQNRIKRHRQDCKNRDLKVYKFIRDNGGWQNWTCEIVERCPCENGDQARLRERHWFETLGATLNTLYPARTKKESQKVYRLANIIEHRRKVCEYDAKRLDVICPNCNTTREISRQQFRKSKNNHLCRNCVILTRHNIEQNNE